MDHPEQNLIRIQVIIAKAGLASRRKAEEFILAGRVSVNGETITSLGAKADPYQDQVALDGLPLPPLERLKYYMFHKPQGYLTALSDVHNRPTISTFLKNIPYRVYPVGRLDKDVSGFLLLTNDGELAKRLMHPSYEIPKVYRARVTGNLTKSVIQKLQNGTIFLDGKPVAPAKAKVIQNGPDQGYLELTLTEGRRHQVKDMCLAVGCPVLLLKRVAYAGIPLDADLAVGETRELREREISSLKKIAGIFKNPHKKAKSTSKG